MPDTKRARENVDQSQKIPSVAPLPVLTGKPEQQDERLQYHRLVKRNVLRDLALLFVGYCLYGTLIATPIAGYLTGSGYQQTWPVVSLALTSIMTLIFYTILGRWGKESKAFRLWRIACDAGIVILLPLGLWLNAGADLEDVRIVFVVANTIGVAGAIVLVGRFDKRE